MSKQRGFIKVNLGEDEKLFKLDLNAIADLEEYFGRGIGAIFTEDNIGFSTIRAFYWAGLKWKEKGLTIERAGQLVQEELQNGTSLEDLMKPVSQALIASGILKEQTTEDEESEETAKN